ncbi:MAG: hypothetical protein ACLP9L_33930 [Thermoguttaceae bacterium]
MFLTHFSVIGVTVFVVLWFALSFFVGWLAVSYRRSQLAWFLLALLFSPAVAYVFLFVAGVPYSAVAFDASVERARKQHPERTDVREIALNELRCPKCGGTVNPATGDGLRSLDNDPWRLICNTCGSEITPKGAENATGD